MTTRQFLLGAGLLSLLACSRPLPAAAATQEAPAAAVMTVNFKDLPLHDAIREVATQAGLRYRIAPNVPNYPISLNIRDVQPEQLFTLLLRQSNSRFPNQGITYSQEQALYVFTFGPMVWDDDAPRPRLRRIDEQFHDTRLKQNLTFTAKNEPLERVVEQIFAGTGVRCQVLPALRKVPINLDVHTVNASAVFRLTLRQVAEAAPGVRLWRENDTYWLGVAKSSSKVTD